MNKHFVTFFSPGTFVHEQSSYPIDSWDVEWAKDMAHNICERHGATPFGFRFETREFNGEEFAIKTVIKSPMYYLGGTVKTLAEVEAANDPDDNILISNMKSNNIARVLINDNSFRSTNALAADDIVLDWKPRVKE